LFLRGVDADCHVSLADSSAVLTMPSVAHCSMWFRSYREFQYEHKPKDIFSKSNFRLEVEFRSL
jgi:hypothetical protein